MTALNIIILAIAWMAGILLADIAGAREAWLWPLCGTGALLGLCTLAMRRRGSHIIPMALCCAALGAARLCAAQPDPTPAAIWRVADGSAVSLAGWVASDPKRTADGQQIILNTEEVRTGAGQKRVEGQVILTLPPFPEYHYGQRLVLTGVLDEPPGPRRAGEFDYRAYLRRKGVLVTLNKPVARATEGESGAPMLRALLALRDRCKAVLLHALPEPQASIAIGVLLGLQSSIPDDVYATFSATGTSHILVVSGWNFTIVATVLAGLTGRLRMGRAATLAISLAMLWTYAFFVGATGTVLRAAVMASLAVIAQASERRTEAWRLLAAACGLLTIADPYVLWDIGFQLSALATASLFAFGKPVQSLLERVPLLNHPWLGWATEALTATLAAQILALPIILYNFGNLSLIAPIANIFLVPVVPYTMFLGTLALVAGLIWQPLGDIVALGVWLPLTWLTEGARFFAQVPYAAVQIPPFPLSALIAYYGITVGGWWWFASRELVGEGSQAGFRKEGKVP